MAVKALNYGAVRTVLITYGVAAFSFLAWLRSQADTGHAPPGYGYVLWGLGLQLLLLVVHEIVKRRMPDGGAAVLPVFELIGDGVTVLFFALGTFGALTRVIGDL